MLKLFAIPAVVMSFGIAGCSSSKEGANYTHVSANDPAMNAAIDKAKASVGEFLSAFRAQRPGTSEFYVKKPYPTPSGGVEHMWIVVLSEQNGELKGRIANDAEDTREVTMGQPVTVKISDISDWKYQNGKTLIGGFTIRYFVDKMSPKEREAFLKEAGFEL